MKKLYIGLAAAAAVAVVACQDASVAPSPTAPRIIAGSPAVAALGSNAWTKEFTVQPTGSTITLFGVYTVNFPANSVCDPQITDQCTPITAPITLTSTVQVSKGRVWVDFKPHLNFVDSPNQEQWVTISTSAFASFLTNNFDYLTSHRSVLRKFNILFADGIGNAPVNDKTVSQDPTLVTHISLFTGVIWRRILHFSGYNIFSGAACDPSPDDPYCIENDPEDPNVLPPQ